LHERDAERAEVVAAHRPRADPKPSSRSVAKIELDSAARAGAVEGQARRGTGGRDAMEKTATLAPMPSASMASATAVKRGWRANIRIA